MSNICVEFLRAWEGGTWDTLIVSVPEDELSPLVPSNDSDMRSDLLKWAHERLGRQAQYRDVMFWGVCGYEEPEGDF